MQAKELFIKYVEDNIQRQGIEELMDWLTNSTDFFTSPASTRFHGSYEGGLLDHSLNVYEQLLVELDNTYGEDNWQSLFSEETVAIVALFHDLCKIDRYTTEQRWRKDDNGKWEEYYPYVYNKEKLEMGHGPQSNFYLQKFIELTDEEAQAIFWHMGAYDISAYASLNGLSSAWNSNALGFLLSRADMFVTYVVENDKFVEAPKVEGNVKQVEKPEVQLAEKTTYLRHDGTDEVIIVKKGEDLSSYFNGPEVFDEVTKKDYEYWKAEQEASEYENKKEKSSKIRMPGKRPAPKPEQDETIEEIEEKEENPKVAPKVSYFINDATGEPLKVYKGESLDFLDKGEYTSVTAKEYKEELAVWKDPEDDVSESDVAEGEQSISYWYDKVKDEYFIVEADEELPEGDDFVEVTEDEYSGAETLEDEDTDDNEVSEENEDDVAEEDTYWFDKDEDTYFVVLAGDLLPAEDEPVEQVSEKEYLDAVQPKLDSDYYYFNTETEKYGILKKGERIPEDFDDEVYEEITKEAYKDATKQTKSEKKPVATQKARRRTPAPTRRPK